MKRVYLLLGIILMVVASCSEEPVNAPSKKSDLSEYCGYEVRAKMSDGSGKKTNYYFCLHSSDTTLYNVSVSKKLYSKFELGDIIECEDGADVAAPELQAPENGYKIVTIGGDNYLVIKLEKNISINDTLNEQKE